MDYGAARRGVAGPAWAWIQAGLGMARRGVARNLDSHGQPATE